jgi:cardiolipin synthase
MTWRTIPNLLTAVRLVLTIPFLYFVLRSQDMAALVVFVVAGLTDSLDGYVARYFNQSSLIGRIADPVADKLLTSAAFVSLAFFHHGLAIPAWVAIAAVSRDILILAGCIALYGATQNAGFRPTQLGKLNTVVEIIVIVSFLVSPKFPAISIVLPSFYVALVLFLILSIGDYAFQGFTMYRFSRRTTDDCKGS